MDGCFMVQNCFELENCLGMQFCTCLSPDEVGREKLQRTSTVFVCTVRMHACKVLRSLLTPPPPPPNLQSTV